MNSLKTWLIPEYTDLNVAPKQEFEFKFGMDVPANADPGSLWRALLVITSPQSGTGSGASVQTRIGLIVLVNVLGDVKENFTLASFTAPRFVQAPPLDVVARFRNDGTVHEAPVGSIEVRNIFGSLVATGTLPLRNVLPGTVRKVTASVGGGVWFGRYTATLRASYGSTSLTTGGDSKQPIEAEVQFWVVPWRKYGPWVLVLGGLAAFIFSRRKRLPAVWHVLLTGKVAEEVRLIAGLSGMQNSRPGRGCGSRISRED